MINVRIYSYNVYTNGREKYQIRNNIKKGVT